MPRLPAFVDERFLDHRRRSLSAGGLAGVMVAMGLFLYHLIHDHVMSRDLLAVGIVAVIVKYAVLVWHRKND
ncbi:MAG: hypothetical protein ABI592_06430 [Acidobacteriota bacterium]